MDAVSTDLAPPDPCPAQFDKIRLQMDPKTYEAYVSNNVPWKVIEHIRKDRCTTLIENANRFTDAKDLRQNGPDELELQTLEFDAPKKKNLVLTRMQGAIEFMKKLKNTQAEMASKPSIAQTICDSDRGTLE